jgi:hypothetical protein
VSTHLWGEAKSLEIPLHLWLFENNGESLSVLYIYAAVATILAITVVGTLSWMAAKIGGEASIDREVDG